MIYNSISKLSNNMDYKWNDPKTYLVFVPGLSLVIQKIQSSDILPRLKTDTVKFFLEEKAEKSCQLIQRICRFHCLGALTQMAASIAALFLLSNPGLIVVAASICLLSTYQYAHIAYVAVVETQLKVALKDECGNNCFKSANGLF